LAFAALVRQNAPTASLQTSTDGGMNRVFVAKLDSATYTYDSDGHLHVPPVQPGRLPPRISPPRGSESDMQAAVAAPPVRVEGSLANAFGGLFSSHAQPAVASADASAPLTAAPERSATATVRKPKPARRDAPAAVAALRPGSAARKDEPQQAEAAKPKPKAQGEQQAEAAKPKPKAQGEQQADALPPPASDGGPVIPSGSFDSRWHGMQ
jgi:hypothetical protein